MITVREIIAITALNFNVEPAEIVADNRQEHVMLARQVAIYVARKLTAHSTPVIGSVFQRDHSTILYSVERIETQLQAAPHGPLAALIASLKKNIEFRQLMEARGGVDVLAVARRVAASPLNNAIGVSVMETAALAATVLDLWEIAQAADELADLVRKRTLQRGADMHAEVLEEVRVLDRHIVALGDAITDELAAMRGEPQQEEEHERAD